jgi:hypothetical protein
LLVNLAGVSRKKVDGSWPNSFDEIGALRLPLLLSNCVRPRLQAIWATPNFRFLTGTFRSSFAGDVQ